MSITDEIRSLLQRLLTEDFSESREKVALLKQLDALSRNADLDPKLAHYLERRSYEKAADHLRD